MIFEVAADAGRQAELVAAAERFWTDHVAHRCSRHRPTITRPRRRRSRAAWGGLETAKVPTVDLDELRDVVDELADLQAPAAQPSTS